jgi:hypothetical protein
VIDFLIHYYRTGAEPFRSLSALPDSEAIEVMRSLYVEGSVIWERFKEPADYLMARRETEAWLRREFIRLGGQPQEPYPIYMVLGRSKWVERMADPATLATTSEIQVPLSILSEDDVSFTYPDSMVTRTLERQKDPETYQPGYHGQVFTLSQIRKIVEERGLPEDGWETKAPAELAHYVEAQVWNRAVLLEYLRGEKHAPHVVGCDFP